MSFWSCKVCAEKDQRIKDLQAQVLLLGSLAAPKVDNKSEQYESLEANLILDGQQEPIKISDVDFNINREADRILSGNYEELIDG